MRKIGRAILVAWVIAHGPALAQDNANSEITGVIQSQIDAFLAEDQVTAFGFASPMIQGMFGSPDNFRRMVETGYPMIWHPSSVEFLGNRSQGEKVYQRVLVRDAAGAVFLFDYEMVNLPGGWKINGVYPVKGEDVGA